MLNEYINKLNWIQRVGVFLWGISVVTILVLHNPIGGYYDFSYNLDKDGTLSTLEGLWEYKNKSTYFFENEKTRLEKKCKQIMSQSQLSDEDLFNYEKSAKFKELKRKIEGLGCYETHYYPISEWSSMEPLLPWFGKLTNLGKV